MKAARFRHRTGPEPVKRPAITAEFWCRSGLVAVFAAAAHLVPWEWLRFLTSECILRISGAFGLAVSRISFDTILVAGQATQFVIACTFVDVFMGSIPLLWDVTKSLRGNALRLLAAAGVLFAFNVLRLEASQILLYRGVSWTIADQVLGGVSYFLVWLAIWRLRSWDIRTVPPPSDSLLTQS